MSDDHRLDEWIRVQARVYHDPPATPRDTIWAGVRARRAGRQVDRGPTVLPIRPPTRTVVGWAAGIAAVLGLGLGLGWVRFGAPTTRPVPPVVVVVGGTGESSRDLAMTIVAVQHFSRVETFLTGFRMNPEEAEALRFTAGAQDLLTSTRLLLDVSSLTPKLRGLLTDLEQVLVQITQLTPEHPVADLDLITDGLEQHQVLPRLRHAIPAGAALRVTGEL